MTVTDELKVFSKYEAGKHLLDMRQVMENMKVYPENPHKDDFKRVIEALSYLLEKEV